MYGTADLAAHTQYSVLTLLGESCVYEVSSSVEENWQVKVSAVWSLYTMILDVGFRVKGGVCVYMGGSMCSIHNMGHSQSLQQR